MTRQQQAFLERAQCAAADAGHIFPAMAACEAALESSYGASQLAREDNNLFGMKQHRHAEFGTHTLPTKEYIDGEWAIIHAAFVRYPSWAACFQDRMVTLLRLRSAFPHYDAALRAPDPITYVREVSRSWATDPNRAEKVIAIYRQYIAGSQNEELPDESKNAV